MMTLGFLSIYSTSTCGVYINTVSMLELGCGEGRGQFPRLRYDFVYKSKCSVYGPMRAIYFSIKFKYNILSPDARA